MIEIKDKKNCCGCNACVSICAHRAITMLADTEGFLYPVVDKDVCIDCGLCEQVCPVINHSSPTLPLKMYIAVAIPGRYQQPKHQNHHSNIAFDTLQSNTAVWSATLYAQ